MRSRRGFGPAVVALTLLAGALPGATEAPPIQPGMSAAEGRAAEPAARPRLPGLPNFGIVSDRLYRGGQPEAAGFVELQKLGVDIVVNFRNEASRIDRERYLVEAKGMRFVSIPWRGQDEPKVHQVAQFLALVRDNPGRRIFAHCTHGSERTGVMIATYRISHDRWTPEQALAEMQTFKFRTRFRHLTRFVQQFPVLLLGDPSLGWGTGPSAGHDRTGSSRGVSPAQGRAGCAGSRTAARRPLMLACAQVRRHGRGQLGTSIGNRPSLREWR